MTERDIFISALQKEHPAERQAYLDEACAGQPEMRRQVENLLRLEEGAGSFLEKAAAESTATGEFPDAAEEASSGEAPGAIIGPYKLLQQIGEGGMGTVWMAQQTAPVKRLVAIKLIKAGMDSRQVIARFEAERQALALMDHANIARVLEAGTTSSGRPYFVMDLVKGVPITRYCDEHHLTPRQRLELFIPVCLAVQHAHHKGIIHRDLKPTNVLVALYDSKPVPKVIDFGVAKAAGSACGGLTEKTLVTGFGTIVGTIEYMSPEQAEINQLDIDTRSDIYSLGVLLYELLAGSPPFTRQGLEKAGMLEMLRVIREQEPSKPSTKLSTAEGLPTLAANRGMEPAKLTKLVRGELDWIVMRALEKDRNRRYETANGFAMDVQRYLRDEPVEACPPSALYRFRKFARRNKRGVLTASVVAVAVAALVAGTLLLQQEQARTAEARAQAATELAAAEAQARSRLETQLYLQRIALADREWSANNLSRMEALLEQCPSDLRGWEWHYLKRLRYRTLSPLRHDSPVISLAFSRDGKLLATGTQAGVVTVWQAKTGQELRQWKAHQTNATSVVFSPDGRYLATGSQDMTAKVWDLEKVLQGEFQAPLLQWEHTCVVSSVTFSPDGQRLASAAGAGADKKGEVKVWDLKTGQEALTLSGFNWAVYDVRFSPDGRRLATASGELVKLWDAQTGREQLTCRDPDGSLRVVTFSPDGRRLAAVGGHIGAHPDREIKVWDAQTGQEDLSLRGHVGGLRNVAFSPDGRRLASTGLDQTVKLWDAATGQEVLTLRGHLDDVFGLAFSPDGHQLASGCTDKTVRIWDATPVEREPGPEYLTLRGHTGAVTDVAFHPTDARYLASAGADGTVRVWDTWSGKELYTLGGSPSSMGQRVAYSLDGRHLAAVNPGPDPGSRADKPVRVWDTITSMETRGFRGHTNGDLCLAFSPDSRHLASAGFDRVVRVWEVTTGKEVQPAFRHHSWPIFGVAFRPPDGRYLASCSGDSTVQVWDWTTGEVPRVLEPRHAGKVLSIAFSRDGELLASGSADRIVKVWDARTWKLLHNLHDPTGAVQCVTFGRDRRRLAWGSTDSTVKVWDGPAMVTHVLRGHTSWVKGLAFSPDGKRIASASLDGTVKIWQAPPEPKASARVTGDQE